MSLSSLKSQLSDKEKDLSKLKNLRTLLTSIEGHIDTVASNLKKAAESMENAGSIGGEPFDKGKTRQYAQDFERTQENIQDASSAVASDIKKLEQDISNLKSEIAAEERRIELERQRKLKEQKEKEEEEKKTNK